MVNIIRNTIQLPGFLTIYYMLYYIYIETMFPLLYMSLCTQENTYIYIYNMSSDLHTYKPYTYKCIYIYIFFYIYICKVCKYPSFFWHTQYGCLFSTDSRERDQSGFHSKSKININNKIPPQIET